MKVTAKASIACGLMICILLLDKAAFSQNETHVTIPGASDSPQFFFDARSTGFTKDGKQRVFEGDVIAIGPKSLVTADKVVSDEETHSIIAEGHVIILTNGQYITGDKIQLWGETGDVKVTNALLVINDSSESDRIAHEILGYSASEIEFEAHRSARKTEIDKKKSELRSEARQRTKEGLNVPKSVIDDYARYLEQGDMISEQENPAFAQMSEARRKTLRKRRDFWEQARLSDRVKGNASATAYFRMTGDTLERTNGNDFKSTDGLWTPCHCEKDEEPAWALRSSKTEAQPGGYATFTNTVLEVKGVPVIYLPWLRVPIKDKRQSGLLMPSTSSDSASGSVFSQPLYIDLGPDKDMTVKAEVFERRGTKIATEYRQQTKQYSGFQLNGELMQDRLWSLRRANRQDLKSLYMSGLDAASDPSQNNEGDISADYSGRDYARMRLRQKSFWDSIKRTDCVNVDPSRPNAQKECRDALSTSLRYPDNDRRGMFRWKAQERFSDRLSLVTTGELYSDRQYNTDLYVPESFEAGFDTGSGERSIQPARAQVHYDGREYYLGIGSSFGDYVLRNDRYEGYQLPSIVKAKTRWYRLGNTGSPIYGNLSTEQYRISRNAGNPEDSEHDQVLLPNAWWRRATGSIIAPISSDSAVQVDHFTDIEARSIAFDSFQQNKNMTSSMQSLRTGFRFQLPIDGKRPLPNWLGGSEIRGEDGVRKIQHLMNWSMTLTGRPTVVRRGPYGESTGPLADIKGAKVFMATDTAGVDEAIKPEDFMSPYQLVTFDMSHRWKIFNELWKKLDGSAAPKSEEGQADKDKEKPTLSFEERARRELLYSMDHPVRKDTDMFSEDQTKWFINRYQLLESDYQEPLSLTATISYDRLKDLKHADALKQHDGKLAVETRPWTEPSATIGINAAGWGLSGTSQYNIYDKIATKHAFSLTPPGFASTNVSLGYTLTQAAVYSENKVSFTETREKAIQLVTSLTKPIFTTYTWNQRDIKDPNSHDITRDYQQKIGLVYASPSKCWGLGFSREKTYGTLEENASYVLQLNIIFMGQARDLPQMGQSIERELKKS